MSSLDRTPARHRCRASLLLVLLAVSSTWATGCASLTNPVAVGVPARRVPAELLAPSKAGEQTIPLTLLGQPTPPEYVLGPGDVLAVVVDGYLGERNLAPPVHTGPLVQARDQRRLTASTG